MISPASRTLPTTAAAAAASALAWRGGWSQGLSYGALGLPLAFVALPLYVVLPNHCATQFGVPLATLGALLLGARLFDAVADPFIGRWVDLGFTRRAAVVRIAAALAALVLALGFRGVFFPPVQGERALLIWCGALLALTYLSYSALAVLHQDWGARLGGDEGQRARIVSWREGLALMGVLVASVLPSVAGLSLTSAVFTVALAGGRGAAVACARAGTRLVAGHGVGHRHLRLGRTAWRGRCGGLHRHLHRERRGAERRPDLARCAARRCDPATGHGQRLESAYFGWLNFATKLNLALAAGIALPPLALFGYASGSRDASALQALTLAHCLLPCALKLIASALLWTLWVRKENRP